MIKQFVRSVILKRFFNIELSAAELDMANEAVEKKYIPAIRVSLIYSVLLVPTLLFLDTSIIVSVLIPVTMVAGMAWFAVSLASIKKKFENFGLELTTDLFVAFTLSLCMLLLATVASLTSALWQPWAEQYAQNTSVQFVTAVLGIAVVMKLIYAIFVGSLKYDINDAMLTGQNEAAERFFKRSLSLLHAVSDSLRNKENSLQVANYSIGVAYYEIFSYIKNFQTAASSELDGAIDRANNLIKQPAMSQEEADADALALAQLFVQFCNTDLADVREHKSMIALADEIACIINNKDEDQAMTDMRLSVVFEEISNLIEEFGENLFVRT